MHYSEAIKSYRSENFQEEADLHLILTEMSLHGDTLLTRDCAAAHLTSSCFVVDPSCQTILFAHHNQRNCWAWAGGHADGETNLLHRATTELLEETGLVPAFPPEDNILSLDVLPVLGHVKNGRYVSAHLHLNVAYLFVCEKDAPLCPRPEENTDVRWFSHSFLQQGQLNKLDAALYQKLFGRAQFRLGFTGHG